MSRESQRSSQHAPQIAAPPASPPPIRTRDQAAPITAPPVKVARSNDARAKDAQANGVSPVRSDKTEAERREFDPRSIALLLFEQAPSWLTSIVFHMLLVIALGLVVYNAPVRVAPVGFELGGGSGQGGFGGDSEDSSGALQSLADDATPPVDIMARAPSTAPQSTVEAPAVEIANRSSRDELSDMFVKGSIRGDGPGLGTGDGTGTGIGSGNSGSGSGMGTASTRTQIFGVREEANSFVYVFDRSDSMNSVLSYQSEGSNVFSITPLEAAKAELLRSLQDLTKQQHFQIVFYNNAASLFRQTSAAQHLLTASRANKRQAEDYVSGTPGAGGTYHFPALEIALGLHPDVIFLMTDGEEKDDPTPDELRALRKLNRGRTRINVIHFCLKARPWSTLEKLARENRGQHLSFLLTKLVPNMMDATDPSRLQAPQRPAPDMMSEAADEESPSDDDDPEEPGDKQ